MIIMMLTILFILLAMLMLMLMFSKKSMQEFQKASPFECGFNPMSNKRLPFSIHFFMIAIIFLVFDIEIIIIMPSIISMKFSLILYWSMTSLMFIMILIMGLYYEWYNGLINWKK